MSGRNAYIFGAVIALFLFATVLAVWNVLARTAGTNLTYVILGGFLLLSSLLVGLFGNHLPKTDMRRKVFIICAFPGALSGAGLLFLGIAFLEVQHKRDWILVFLGLSSFAAFQFLFVYVLVKARRMKSHP